MLNLLKFVVGPGGLILLGALISAMGGVLAISIQNKAQNKLIEKNEEIAELSNKIVGLVTGGDSYCYLGFFYNPTRDSFVFYPIHEGEYPIYDVELVITDQQKLNKYDLKEGPVTVDIFQIINEVQTHKSYKSLVSFKKGQGTISKSSVFELHPHNKDIHQYGVSISARNGYFKQIIKLAYVDNTWISATKVVREIDNKLMVSSFDSRFPRNENGEVEW